MTFNGDLILTSAFDGDMDVGGSFSGELGTYQKVVEVDVYTGPTTATPGDEQQVFLTKDLMLPENFVVEKIPSNYGKITWNGSVLTVS